MAEKKSPSSKKRRKELVLRALTDPKFRKLLATDPKEALGRKEITPTLQKEIGFVLAVVRGIETQISLLADELLCVNGPCGIA